MKLQSWPALRARILPLAAKMSLYAERNWKWLTVLLWIGAMAYMVSTRWPQIQWLTLNDTDDNIRYLQVKDWLAGQDRKSTRLNSSHSCASRMPASARKKKKTLPCHH